VARCDKRGNTLLHLVISTRSPKPALIHRIWEMNPDALFVANAVGNTGFECAIRLVNEWTIEHFQWKLSIWSVEEALAKERQRHLDSAWEEQTHSHPLDPFKALQRLEQRFREVVRGECERPLLLSLPRDCVHLISDLFISVFGDLEAF